MTQRDGMGREEGGGFTTRDQTQVSPIAGRFFTTEPSGKPYLNSSLSLKILFPKEVTFTVTGG